MDTLLGQGYDQKIGTRTGTGDQVEFYNKDTSQGFSNPNSLSDFVNQEFGQQTNFQSIFDTLKGGITPVKVDLPQQIPAKTLENPVSAFDTNSLLTQNNQIAQQYPELNLTPQEYRDKTKRFQNCSQKLRYLSYGGISQIRNKPIALEFQQGQEAAVTRMRLSPVVFIYELSAQTDALTALQSQRVAQQQALAAQMQNGQLTFLLPFATADQRTSTTSPTYRTSYGIVPVLQRRGTIYDQ